MTLEDAIQQRTFKHEYQKLAINLLYTSSWLNQINTQSIRPFGITWQQFNILRILRGRHPEPATVKLLTERMIDKMSNASRLVDKLVKKGYVERRTCADDRRRVDIVLTDAGRQMLDEASASLEGKMFAQFNSLSEAEAAQMNDLLDRLRTDD